MNVLITGITGLLGRAIACRAHEAGYRIFGMSRNPEAPGFDFPVTWITCDLTNKLESISRSIDVIIHCAADTTMGAFANEQQDRVNVGAVQQLVRAALAADIKKFILVSTAKTLKPGTPTQPGNEASRVPRSSAHLNYINSKIKAEAIVRQAVEQDHLDAVIVNPTFIIHPEAGNTSSNRLLNYALKRAILFYPEGGKNFVDARDASQAIISAVQNGRKGENYILSGQQFTYREFYQLAIRERGSGALLVPVPAWLLMLSGYFFSWLERLLSHPIGFNVKVARLLIANNCYTSAKAIDQLGFKPVPFASTVKQRQAIAGK